MATKTIKTNVTLHVPGKGHAPFKIDPSGAVMSGAYKIEKIAPGTEIELPEIEADAILARHGGEVVASKAANPASAQAPAR